MAKLPASYPIHFPLDHGELRVRVDDNGAPWFVAADVCKVLGYTNPREALRKHVDVEDKGVTNRDTFTGPKDMAEINESGLYSLILRSKKPEARAFKRKVTSEILPEIRRTGSYQATEAQAKIVEAQAQQIERLQRQLAAYATWMQRRHRMARTIGRVAPNGVVALERGHEEPFGELAALPSSDPSMPGGGRFMTLPAVDLAVDQWNVVFLIAPWGDIPSGSYVLVHAYRINGLHDDEIPIRRFGQPEVRPKQGTPAPIVLWSEDMPVVATCRLIRSP